MDGHCDLDDPADLDLVKDNSLYEIVDGPSTECSGGELEQRLSGTKTVRVDVRRAFSESL